MQPVSAATTAAGREVFYMHRGLKPVTKRSDPEQFLVVDHARAAPGTWWCIQTFGST